MKVVGPVKITKYIRTETYKLGDFRNRKGVMIQVEFVGLNSIPTGVVRLMVKDPEAANWSHVTGMTADIADYASDGTGSVVFHEMSIVNGTLGIEYTRGDESTGLINMYTI